jgi:hypothetical protein
VGWFRFHGYCLLIIPQNVSPRVQAIYTRLAAALSAWGLDGGFFLDQTRKTFEFHVMSQLATDVHHRL